MAQESLAPVAAITNMILGIITILMSNRGDSQSSHKRFSALLIGWTFIFLSLYNLAETLLVQYYFFVAPTAIDLGLVSLQGITGRDTLVLIQLGADAALNIIMLVMAMHIPKDMGRGDSWNSLVILVITLYCIVVPPLVFLGGFRYAAFQMLIWVAVGIFWTHTYIHGIIQEHKTGEEHYRSESKASAVLLLIWFGWQMIWWLSAFTFLNNEWFVSVLTQLETPPTAIWLVAVNLGWSIGAVIICALLAGEAFRTSKRGLTAISLTVFVVFFLGFANWIQDTLLLDAYYSCIEGNCETESSIFELVNYLTSGVLIYLLKPLLLVYLMVQFQIIDTSKEENRNLTRIMILLILLIISSSVIELIQSMIPIPQMISGSLLAIGVIFFIGWEEKITESFIGSANSSDIDSIQGDGFNDQMLRNTSLLMSLLVTYIIVLAVIFANTGV
ncbi:MAG TPA: hypothetical protein QGI72_04420 [Poseidonia sp.]|nr:hypothetical protein [Poseidonia sp.]